MFLFFFVRCLQILRKLNDLNLLAQITEAKSAITGYEIKITELTCKINDLERELTVKSWNIDRMYTELRNTNTLT